MKKAHDIRKLPKWAQRRIAELERETQAITFTATRTFTTKQAIVSADGGINLLAGDSVEFSIPDLKERLARQMGFTD